MGTKLLEVGIGRDFGAPKGLMWYHSGRKHGGHHRGITVLEVAKAENKPNRVIRRCHPYIRKKIRAGAEVLPYKWFVACRVQLTLHATHRTPHGVFALGVWCKQSLPGR